jgi:hypothetical protein
MPGIAPVLHTEVKQFYLLLATDKLAAALPL